MAGMESREIRLERVRALAGRLRKLEQSRVHMLPRTRDGLIDESAQGGHAERVVSTGCRSLDEVLMDGGLRRGALVEWINGRYHFMPFDNDDVRRITVKSQTLVRSVG